jgi:methyl halide transferase
MRRATTMASSAEPVKSNAAAFRQPNGGTDWESMWSAGSTGFDCKRTEPALQRALDAGEVAIGRGKCLVPGCGRGYALASLARGGFRDVVGLEISETARAAAEAHLRANETDVPGDATIRIVVEDFFAHAPEVKYDFVYDCTFLCAIEPSRRGEWAKTMSRCIKPNGTITSLVFPCGDFEGGPPYALSPALVKDLLVTHGFEEVSLEEVEEKDWARGRMEYFYTFRRSAA